MYRTFLLIMSISVVVCCAPPQKNTELISADEDNGATEYFRAGDILLPLKTQESRIVDSENKRVKLAGVNWYGASDEYHVVGGLDITTPEQIAALIAETGFNSVRLPFSNEMLHATSAPAAALAANPELQALTPLEIFDRIIEALAGQNLLIILNNHTTSGEWCCNLDDNALWYNEWQTEQQWIDDWVFLVERYRDNRLVVGADLRNEIRIGQVGDKMVWAEWGGEGQNDWHRAATGLGNLLLGKNPDLLIVVEGLNYSLDFRDFGSKMILLDLPGRLVYSPHSYSWSGLGAEPHGGLSYDELASALDEAWGYLAEPGQEYTAPLWISEFGEGPQNDQDWLQNFTSYLRERDFDWCWWPINNGPKPGGGDESWGLVTQDWSETIDDWRMQLLQGIIAPVSVQ
jgi:endoglucanase